MQITRINATNFYGAKNTQAIKKAVKPAAEKIESNFNVYAYGVPTGEIAKPVTVEQAAKLTDAHVKNFINNSKKDVVEAIPAELKGHEYLSASMLK